MSIQRREFMLRAGLLGVGGLLGARSFAIPAAADSGAKAVRVGIISDLHHLQFGQDEEARIRGFMDAVIAVKPDFIIQNGDFCRPKGSEGIMREWNRFGGPKYHVLGNHDMDVCDKQTIMTLWGMPKRYYSFDAGGFHFVVMDRNLWKKDDGTLTDYDTGNWPRASILRSYSDREQLEWLRADLAATEHPVIVFMHQPVFLSDFFQEIGNADEILTIFDEANLEATRRGRRSLVSAVFMGHDHDDRYGQRNGVHYFMLNSATYAYRDKAYFYKDPLYAFMTLDPAGSLKIEGRNSSYVETPPDKIQALFQARISSRTIGI